MALALTVTLYDGSTTITLPAPPPDIDAPETIPGVVHRTQGGSLVHYQVGPKYFEATFNLVGITNAQKISLQSFFDTNWGSSFTYTDAAGNTFTAYFLDTTLPLHKVFKDWWECHLHLQLSAVLI